MYYELNNIFKIILIKINSNSSRKSYLSDSYFIGKLEFLDLLLLFLIIDSIVMTGFNS